MNNEEHFSDEAPRESHWHYTMVKQRVWGLFDIRVALLFPLCLINLMGWWTHFKLPIIGVTLVLFTALEFRRITLEIALRLVCDWLRGPHTPGIATAAQTYLGYRPHPLPPRGNGNGKSRHGLLPVRRVA